VTDPVVITLGSGGSLDDFRTALASLELASLLPADEKKLAVVREVITTLQNRLTEHGKAEALALDDRQLHETKQRDAKQPDA
jgi:hypothetical protein